MSKTSDKTRILYVITSSGIGGAEKQLYELVNRLDKDRFEPFVCSLKPLGGIGEMLKNEGIAIFSLDMPDVGGIRGMGVTMRSIYRLLMLTVSLSPHLIHTWLFRANQVGRFIGWVQDVPVVSSIRVQEVEKGYHHTCDGKTSFMVDHYTAVSDEVRDFTIQKSKLKPEKITTIVNGIDMTPFDITTPDAALAGQLGIQPGDRVLTTVGRLNRQKGLPVLLQAFKGVLDTVPEARLLVVGEGEELEPLKTMAREMGIEQRVLFPGLRRDIPAILARTEVFVLPSLWEGMPNAVLEAMATGRPVVATRVGGVSELMVEGETGVIVPPSDAPALQQAILAMLSNPEQARLMGEKGRERAMKHFDIRLTVRKTEELYRRVLKQRGVEV
ncbi:MAG: glycosyltransferase [Nitrospirota bacterium]|nr:glycosyltransferase [Nitrospirota bacterium]